MGMDKKIKKKTWTSKRILMVIGVIAIIGLSVYAFVFMDVRSTLNVEKEKITISTVEESTFQEFIQENGIVQPIQTIYLDAIEGGVVEEVYIESGVNVEKGDTILTLANSTLQLNVLRQTSTIYDQINQTRNSRLNIEQNTLNLKQQLAGAQNQLNINRAEFLRQKKLYERNRGLVSEQTFLEAKENYNYQKKRYDLLYEVFKQDSIKANRQIQQIDQSLDRMQQSLEGVQQMLDRLVVKAPISGQLSTIELNQGQSISNSERIGQVDILDDYKVRVGIDEYHLSRITTGLKGSFSFAGNTHNLTITKVYPVINEGQFEVDMEFIGEAPDGLRRGQTLRIRLELGESSDAILLSRGGFYQTTGGNWVFVLNEDGTKAVRRNIRLGRQNPEYFEVVSGLQAGDRVITSGYDTFGNNEVLVLD
ncbi:MAG: HlyD family efflux transporter periplasmic adaptor subunit [Balneolaceae bacterium]|nr:HlyD family efflux transporter periplasmic adaptor subunit [Balneolaceae bacterium]